MGRRVRRRGDHPTAGDHLSSHAGRTSRALPARLSARNGVRREAGGHCRAGYCQQQDERLLRPAGTGT
ncbi:hypothetical protein G6F54_014231 [Rhizopus delemar]|nr:hypothetical protein G6F54_014231 [Rhizopus delemar]